MKKLVALLLFIASPALAHTEFHECCTLDQKIDVASVEPMAESVNGKSTAVLDQYLLDEEKKNLLIDSIYGVPGITAKDITGLGSVRIRGARSFDTKYLYDGFPLKDPSNPQNSWGSFLGDTLSFGNSEIQLLKGSASDLYGSEAIGGVVDIVPQTGQKPSFDTSYGSREAFTEKFDSEPVSAAYSTSQDYETENLRISNDFDGVTPFLIYQNTEAPLNNGPSLFDGVQFHDRRDENDRREVTYIQTGVKVEKEPYMARVSYSNSDRRFEFLPNSDGSGFWSDGTFGGETFYADLNATVMDTILGYTYQHDWMSIESEGLGTDYTDLYQNDLYAEREWKYGNLDVLVGGRYSMHEYAKDRAVYDLSASYNLDGYILRSHYGTAYRSPSLYELHGAFLTEFGRFEIGNEGLSPERATSLDFGVEKTFADRITVGATFFRHTLLNRIDFQGAGYANVDGRLDTYGYEAFYEQFLWNFASARVSYTRTIQPGLTDVAPQAVDASLRLEHGKWKLFSGLGWRDDHTIQLFDNSDFLVKRTSEKGYAETHVTLSYKPQDNVELYVRGENLLNDTYYDGGYRKQEYGVYGGIKIEL